MSLTNFYTVGNVYWCKTHEGEWVLGKAEGINDDAKTIKMRTPDQAVCWWPYKLVKTGGLWGVDDFRERHDPTAAVREVWERWGIFDDSPVDRMAAWRTAAAGGGA